MYLPLLLYVSVASTALAGVAREQTPVWTNNHVYRGQINRPLQHAVVPNEERAAAVKEAFTHAWTGYKTYAFPNDELHSVSNTFGNSR